MKKHLTRLPALIAICLFALLSRAISVDLNINQDPNSGEVVLGIQTTAGVEYVVYTSEEMEIWTPMNQRITGDGQYQEVRIATSKPAEFFRIAKAAYWNEFTWGESAWQ